MDTDSQYPALRAHVEAILSEGKTLTRQAGEGSRLETYWHIGDALNSHIGGSERAEYGQQVVVRLSRDLAMTPVLLWDILLFRRTMPALPTLHARELLSWTHFRRLIRLPTQAQRRFYQGRAADERWSVRQLEQAIRADAYTQDTSQPWAVPPDEDPSAGRPLKPAFGHLHTYRLVQSGHPADPSLCLDLGFHVTCAVDLSDLEAPRPGAIVSVRPDTPHPDASPHTPYPIPQTLHLRPANTGRYTYVAWVERVVDGDTLIAVVDLGLGHFTRPLRFRLRGIDCPELSTQAGRNARDFVETALGQVEFIVLATHRTDTYGRYLADVRYLPGESAPELVRTRGTYLNGQLLQEHLAVRYLR